MEGEEGNPSSLGGAEFCVMSGQGNCLVKRWSRRGHQFRNHQFQDVHMKPVLKRCCLIQPIWMILAL